jgi:hypothetical protein
MGDLAGGYGRHATGRVEMGEQRRFTALRRRLTALEQEAYTTARVIENTDWRDRATAELASFEARRTVLEDEAADIEYLIELYNEYTHKQPLIVTPQTVATVALLIVLVFIGMTLAAGTMAGVFYAN